MAQLLARFSSEPKLLPRTNCSGIGGRFGPENADKPGTAYCVVARERSHEG